MLAEDSEAECLSLAFPSFSCPGRRGGDVKSLPLGVVPACNEPDHRRSLQRNLQVSSGGPRSSGVEQQQPHLSALHPQDKLRVVGNR